MQVKPAATAASSRASNFKGTAAQARVPAIVRDEDSEPEGSEVSYDSDPAAPQASEPESDAGRPDMICAVALLLGHSFQGLYNPQP